MDFKQFERIQRVQRSQKNLKEFMITVVSLENQRPERCYSNLEVSILISSYVQGGIFESLAKICTLYMQ